MASAVLANRNEPDWTQPRGGAKFMGKIPFSNPNPKFSKKRKFHAAPVVDIDVSPAVTQSVGSDDASSINRKPSDVSSGGYVTFNVASYSKKELAQLKSRLLSELEQIRQLKTRIEADDFHIRSSSNVLPPKKSVNKNNSGNKRPLPSSFVNDLKKSTSNSEIAPLMKGCGQILSKLMKTKHGYLFNKPVDVVGLGLHDYHDVIKHPMDLGTVKLKLGKNSYESPLDFAADVRLIFNNAMAYNPKGHDVHVIADQLLGRFEELFRPLNVKLGDQKRHERVNHGEFQSSSWNRSEPERLRKDGDDYVAQNPSSEIPMRNPASVSNPNPNSQSTMQMPVRTPSPMRSPPVKPVKQPKPKAKDPNKREMSMEEKHRLGLGLQSLPPEKMEQVIQIIRKRNGHLTQDGDEIELDIEAVDIETLWELDRFVTNYKKMVSKIKRQALMGINVPANEVQKVEVPGNERIEVAAEAEKPKKGDAAGDEDVDIGDEMPMSSFPPVEIEKDNGHASSDSSSSGSSTSDSSSSSDSDSGSSSGSDSDDAQS